MHLSVEPSESIVKFAFLGYFRPEMYGALWLVQNDIIDISESKAAKDLNIDDKYRRFSYNFITIIVKPDRFTIGISDYHVFDFLLDFTKSVYSVIKGSIQQRFELFTNFHFEVQHKRVEVILDKFQSKVEWDQIFNDNVNLESLVVSSDIALKGMSVNTQLNLAKCGRQDMNNHIHIFIRHTVFPMHKFTPRDPKSEPKLQFYSYDKQLLKMTLKSESIVEFLLTSYILK